MDAAVVTATSADARRINHRSERTTRSRQHALGMIPGRGDRSWEEAAPRLLLRAGMNEPDKRGGVGEPRKRSWMPVETPLIALEQSRRRVCT